MKLNYLSLPKNDWLTFFLLSSFPISIILGNFFINLYYLLFTFNFMFNFKQNKFFFFNKINYLLIFFFCSLLLTVFFSQNWQNSLPRVIKFVFIFILLIESQRLVCNNEEKINFIFKIWSIIFASVCFDIVFEIIFGHNLLGFTSYMPGRIASFFGDELVVGAFFHGFVLYFVAYSFSNYPQNKNLIVIIIIILIMVSFFIGERSNFLKVFFSLFIFSTIIFKIKPLKNFLILISVILIMTIFLNFNEDYKIRYYDQTKQIFKNNGVSHFFSNSQYGAHQIVAYKIFKNYPLFGVGVKNFRTESAKKIYEEKNKPYNSWRQATHPHQLHLEFLSETGIIGYISFLIFILSSVIIGIKKYLISKNLYLLSSLIFIASSVLPILPSGSFLSTFSGGIFWINYVIMCVLTLVKFKD